MRECDGSIAGGVGVWSRGFFPRGTVMARLSRRKLGCLCAIFFIVVVILVTPFQGLIWDGGFSSIEYRLRFLDTNNRPLQGVTLQVRTQAGCVCYLYPVNEFISDQAPTSDSEGNMVFHHVSHTLEFAGHEYSNLLGFRFGETQSPQYDCVFLVEGREVSRVRFNRLCSPGCNFLLPISRDCSHSAWDEWLKRKWQEHCNDEGWIPASLLFDCNGDSHWDREQKTAASYMMRSLFERYELKRESDEHKFAVLERTIIIDLP